MVAGRKHIALQYEWTEKLKKKPYNCNFVQMEYFLQLPIKDFYVDVYGKNINGKEFVVEIGNLGAKKYEILKNHFKDNFIYIPFEPPTDPKCTSKTRKISVRVPQEIYDVINTISFENNKTFSANFAYFIKQGMVKTKVIDNIQNFLNEQEVLMMKAMSDDRLQNLGTEIRVLERDNYQCRKCGSKSMTMEYILPPDLIGKTWAGMESESRITLCTHCLEDLKKYIPKRYELERFIEWYYK